MYYRGLGPARRRRGGRATGIIEAFNAFGAGFDPRSRPRNFGRLTGSPDDGRAVIRKSGPGEPSQRRAVWRAIRRLRRRPRRHPGRQRNRQVRPYPLARPRQRHLHQRAEGHLRKRRCGHATSERRNPEKLAHKLDRLKGRPLHQRDTDRLPVATAIQRHVAHRGVRRISPRLARALRRRAQI